MKEPFRFIPGESFNGAVARWADEVGGMERMLELTRVGGVRHGHRQRSLVGGGERGIRAIAAEMGVDPEELLSRAVPNPSGDFGDRHYRVKYAGMDLPTHLIEKRTRRFSPAALARSPHHRALWDVRLLPACVETGEILLDRCGGAGCGPVGWSATLGIDLCDHCASDLTKAATVSVPDATHTALRELAGLFSHDGSVRAATLAGLPPLVAGLGPADVVDLLVRVMMVADADLPTNVALMLAAPPQAVCAAIAAAWTALSRWPDGMSALASERIRGRIGKHNDGNRGRTMRFLKPSRQKGASSGVLELTAAWRRSVSIDLETGSDLRRRTVNAVAVAQTTGLDLMTVYRHRRAGTFEPHFVLCRDRPEVHYDNDELVGIAAALADRSSMPAACSGLGMSIHGVEQLLAMRLLDDLEHPFLDAHYGTRQVSRRSLLALEAAIEATAPAMRVGEGAGLELRGAMRGVGGRVKPWGPAFVMLVSGELPFELAEGDRPLSERVLVGRAAVPLLRSLHLPDRVAAGLATWMSKADAGEVMNLAPVRATKFLKRFPTVPGSRDKVVPLDEIERLARRHIAPGEMAIRRGVSAVRAHFDAVASNIPLLGPGGFCRERAEAAFFAT